MRKLLLRTLGTIVLFVARACCASVSTNSSREAAVELAHDFAKALLADEEKILSENQESASFIERRSIEPRSYYNGVPAAPYIPAFDPISVLASLAFLAFLMQSFAALFDRTRSIIPTIISNKRSSSGTNEQFAEVENRVLRALEEYANLSDELLGEEKEAKKFAC